MFPFQLKLLYIIFHVLPFFYVSLAQQPTTLPTRLPTSAPTRFPTAAPTLSPSPIPTSSPSFFPTIDDPKLVSFELDYKVGRIELEFDRLVIAASLKPSFIHIQATKVLPIGGTTIPIPHPYNDMTEQGNSTIVFFYMTSDDYARLAFDPIIGNTIESTFLTMERGAIVSIEGRTNVYINSTNSFKATSHIADTLPPYVISFSLNMNSGVLSILWSEPIRSLQMDGLAVQQYRNSFRKGVYVKLIDDGFSLINSTNYDRFLQIQLGTKNLNLITTSTLLAIDAASTYLSSWKPFANDSSGNPSSMAAFEKLYGMPVTEYVFDTTSPRLLYWDFDFNEGCVVLYFSETVRYSYLNYTTIMITNQISPSPSSIYQRFVDPLSFTSENSDVMRIYFSLDQLNFLRGSVGICDNIGNTYLVLDKKAIVDCSDNLNPYLGLDATIDSAMQARAFIPDSTPPQITSFSIDLTLKTITIMFSELVPLNSIDINALIIQSQKASDVNVQYVALTSSTATLISTVSSDEIVISLLDTVFNAIKDATVLASSASSTYLAASALFAKDRASNPLIPISAASAQAVSNYTADFVPPYLASWSIDMNDNILILEFSEPIDSATLILTDIVLSNDAVRVSTTIQVTLGVGSVVINKKIVFVTIQLSPDDIVKIKGQSPLCLYASTCFLSHSSLLGKDTISTTRSGILMQNAIIPSIANPVKSYISDIKSPKLVVFNIDLNSGALELIFDEPVLGQNFLPSGLRLFNSKENAISATNGLRLSAYSVVQGVSSDHITVILTNVDYINLKNENQLCTSSTTCFLTIDTSTVDDMAGNAVNSTGYRSVLNFIPDSTGPVIDAFTYNQTSLNCYVYFNDVISVSSVDLTAFYLVSDLGLRVDLGKAILLNPLNTNSYFISLDLNPLRSSILTQGIGLNQASTKIYISRQGAVADATAATNNNARMTQAMAFRAGSSILSFRLDMSLGAVIVELAIPIDVSYITAGGISFSSTSGLASYSLTSYISFEYIGTNLLTIKLVPNDYGGIQSRIPLISKDSLTATFSSISIVDTKGFTLSSTVTLPCSQLITDRIPPSLLYYTLDMRTGILDMYFSENVKMSSISVRTLTFVDSRNNASNSVSLTDAIVLTTDVSSSQVSISIGGTLSYPTGRDRIHLSKTIAVSLSKTFLVIDRGFVHDTATPPNYLEPISSLNASRAYSLILDDVPPKLVSYTLDMTALKLTLNFDEAVDATRNIPNYYTFGQNPNDPFSAQYTLNYANTSRLQSVGNIVVMYLSTQDFDRMMLLAPNLCLSTSNCYLSFKYNAIRDIATRPNPIDDNFFRYGMPVTIFQADRIPPSLLSYDLSMQLGFIDFFFDEVVDCSQTKLSELSLQYALFSGETSPQKYTFTNASTLDCIPRYSKSIRLQIGLDPLIILKAYTSLLKSAQSTYLLYNTGAFSDTSRNNIVGIIDGRSRPVDNFFPDTVSPNLLSFTVSGQAVLTLVFDEPVDPTSLDITKLFFQNSLPPYTKSYVLSASRLLSFDSSRMILLLQLLSDYTTISGDSFIFARQLETFLRVQDGAISDMSRNPLTGLNDANALGLGPSIKQWELDMNAGSITLFFSESVNSSFSVAGAAIQVDSTGYNSSVTLSTKNKAVNSNSINTFVNILSDDDLNRIKYNRVATSISASYLTAPFGLTFSTSAGTIIPYLKTAEIRSRSAMRARRYTPDTTPPICNSFDLDLNVGLLTLQFTEPIIVSASDLTSITLVSATGSSARLSNSLFNVELKNMTNIVITIPRIDLNLVKAASLEGVLSNLLISSGGFSDFSGNQIVGNSGDKPILIGNLVVDTSAPYVITMKFDLGTGIIDLLFNEYIQISSLKVVNVLILSINSISDPHALQLSNFSVVEPPDIYGSVKLDLGLYNIDLDAITANPNLANTVNDTFLAVRYVADIFQNVMSGWKIYQADVVTSDQLPLRLASFDFLHVSSYTFINFYFYKPCKISTFTCNSFIFRTSPADSVGISVGNNDCNILTTTSSSKITVKVPTSIFSNNILGSGVGFFSAETTWVSISSGSTISDLYGNTLSAISAAGSLRVGPRITKFLLDMNMGTATFIFSRIVNLFDRFNATSIGFYSSVSQKKFFLSSEATKLTSVSDFRKINDTSAFLTFSQIDLSYLKSIDLRAGSTFLLIKERTLYDTDGQELNQIVESDKIGLSKFVSDSVRPLLLNITIDLSLNVFVLVFNEPIRPTTFQLKNIQVQSTNGGNAVSYRLQGGSAFSYLNNVNISLLASDAGAIKLTTGLAKNKTNTFLSLAFKSAEDMAGNFLRTVSTASARATDVYIPDTIGPVLNSFDINIDTARVILYFSEPVRVSSFHPSQITFQSRFSSTSGANYTISTGEIRSSDGFIIEFLIPSNDIVGMKNIAGLLRTKQSTYIVAPSTLVTDLAGNLMTPILDGKALPCSSFIADTTRPYVVKVNLDLDSAIIDVYMSELVDLGLVDIGSFTIQSTRSLSGASYGLTRGKSYLIPQTPFVSVVRIQIHEIDLNSMKSRYPLISSANNTWFSFAPSFAYDTFRNPLVAIYSYYADPVFQLLPDTIAPTLKSYSIDMNYQKVILTFSEAMLTTSLRLDQLIIQTTGIRRFGASSSFAGCNAEFGLDADSVRIIILLAANTTQYLKYYGIGSSASLSLLSWSDIFISDTAGHYLLPVWDGSVGSVPYPPDEYLPDTTAPLLLRFYLDRVVGAFHFVFDEPAKLLNVSAITIFKGTSLPSLPIFSTGQRLYLGANSIVGESFNTEIILKINDFCSLEIQALSDPTLSCPPHTYLTDLRANKNPLYLTVPPSTFVDYSSIPVSLEEINLQNIRKEGGPDCSPCPSGQYTSRNCTLSSDRVCSTCSQCHTGAFIRQSCSQYQNTICKLCSPCSYGEYISGACMSTSTLDTKCTKCKVCGHLEYSAQECSTGLDTVCNSCKTCLITDSDVMEVCLAANYLSWAFENCCFDAVGNPVTCRSVDLVNLLISTRSGRHHWTFDVTSPKVDGVQYALGKVF